MDPTVNLTIVMITLVALYTVISAYLFAACQNAGGPDISAMLTVAVAPIMTMTTSKRRPTVFGLPRLPRLAGYALPHLAIAAIRGHYAHLVCQSGEYAGADVALVARHTKAGSIDCAALDMVLGRHEAYRAYRIGARNLGAGIGTVWGHPGAKRILAAY